MSPLSSSEALLAVRHTLSVLALATAVAACQERALTGPAGGTRGVLPGADEVGAAALPLRPGARSATTAAAGRANGIVWTNTVTGGRTITSLAGSPSGTASGAESLLGSVPLRWEVGAAADWTGDGEADLLVTNTETGERQIWPVQNSALTGYRYPLPASSTTWHIAAAADFNGDGWAEVLWENLYSGERGIWVMHGGTFLGWAPLLTQPVSWRIAGAADFTGDGKVDILWQNPADGRRSIWPMDGLRWTGTNVELPTRAPEWDVVDAADIDGDADADVLWQNTATGELGIWIMDHLAVLASLAPGVRGGAYRAVAAGNFRPPLRSDSTAPVLDTLSLTPDSVGVAGASATVVARMRLLDDLSGTATAALRIQSPSGAQSVAATLRSPTGGTRTDGGWEASLVIPAGAEPGTWRVVGVALADEAGNGRVLDTTALDGRGLPTRIVVTN